MKQSTVDKCKAALDALNVSGVTGKQLIDALANQTVHVFEGADKTYRVPVTAVDGLKRYAPNGAKGVIISVIDIADVGQFSWVDIEQDGRVTRAPMHALTIVNNSLLGG